MLDPESGQSTMLAFLNAYREPGRHYHTIAHINHCLREYREVEASVINRYEMWLAIWFHDVVYSVGPNAGMNEWMSAFEARKMVRSAKSQRIVTGLILVTMHSPDYEPLTLDECLMCDIDLSILGAAPEDYAEYSRNIRKEYDIYPDPVYNVGRVRVLEKFLERDRIYRTAHFQKKYERQARTNILAEVSEIGRRTLGL
jgi:predicted metal-dependent HD superfamily phosphohydrolase